MGDEWFPSEAPMLEPWLRNFVDNPLMVQFVHRWLAFVVAAAILMLAHSAWRRGFRGEAALLAASVTTQILLGIATLLSGVELEIAAAHQAMAVVLLGATVLAAHRLGNPVALPLEGGGLGGGGLSAGTAPFTESTPPQPSPSRGGSEVLR
jgi:cytochrome c oxidase assembly protein subunit 15